MGVYYKEVKNRQRNPRPLLEEAGISSIESEYRAASLVQGVTGSSYPVYQRLTLTPGKALLQVEYCCRQLPKYRDDVRTCDRKGTKYTGCIVRHEIEKEEDRATDESCFDIVITPEKERTFYADPFAC